MKENKVNISYIKWITNEGKYKSKREEKMYQKLELKCYM
jgi:hypothetical protein